MSSLWILILAGFCAQLNIVLSGPAENQLPIWASKHKKTVATSDNYAPVSSLTATDSIGPKGPVLLADVNFQQQIAHFTRERIPERFMYASSGAGARGYFELTRDMSNYTEAKLFGKVGRRTPVVVRFSSASGNIGSPDTTRDTRGIAVKFKTTEGNYDLLMANMEACHIRDAMLFPGLLRAMKRNPATHLVDYDAIYDLLATRTESTLAYLQGATQPRNYRYIDGHSINTFAWVGGKAEKEYAQIYVRYHLFHKQQGRSTMSIKKADQLAGSDPDYMVRDLYNAIGRKKFPRWTLAIQIFTAEDVQKATFDLFDPTKMLFASDNPLVTIGTLVLNANPSDYFNEVEQLAFNPGNHVPGIQPSPDHLLQGRFFTYLHAQFHRLGSNFYQLPINRPAPGVQSHTYLKDGFMNLDNGDGAPNVFPNSFNGPVPNPKARDLGREVKRGKLDTFETSEDKNLFQVDRYWREVMTKAQQRQAIQILASELSQASDAIRERSLQRNWDAANTDLGQRLRRALAKGIKRRVFKRKPKMF